ncbi:hypothetical protein E0L36_20505 [Streptomyces sp. AJS327]|uniref:PrpF domain-containing protein n=1 Tax=Streptomyces sp. AJS327 TaxID=2545265 RepID=UPI0015DFFF4C|nr:PrpF domain-containing protein [Streptomyces sp. AJS327]MBA0053166.1 hypothetical protein [Streptomyces sp. AJS327]
MRADLVRAEGAPGPTLVLDRDLLPPGALALRSELLAVRDWLAATGRTEVTKIGLYGAARAPGWDLDYRFVQCLPGPGAFDFRTGCGHSLLACAVGSGLPGPLRVRALTTGEGMVCVPERDGSHTVRLHRRVPLPGLLPSGRPAERLGGLPVSLVWYGNPYVFVDAAALGLPTEQALFTADEATLAALRAVREAAARTLGVPAGRALPKVAAVGAYRPGRLSVRAVTTHGWHPALAVTGTLCLAAAAAVPGTVPHRLLAADATAGPLRVRTPGGGARVGTELSFGGRVLDAAVVYGKRVRVLERSISLPWRIHVTA